VDALASPGVQIIAFVLTMVVNVGTVAGMINRHARQAQEAAVKLERRLTRIETKLQIREHDDE
jgi:hypothetical protein